MNSSNGRVDIKTPNTSTLFEMYDKIPAHQCTTFRNPTEGLWDETILSNAYFFCPTPHYRTRTTVYDAQHHVFIRKVHGFRQGRVVTGQAPQYYLSEFDVRPASEQADVKALGPHHVSHSILQRGQV